MNFKVILKSTLGSFLIALVFVLNACSSIPLASDAKDQKAKKFEPISDRAVIYAFRQGIVNGAWPTDFIVDGKYVGQIRPGQFLALHLRPGKHVLTVRTDSKAALSIDVSPGKLFFYELSAPFKFFSTGAEIKLVDQQEGIDVIRNSRLVETFQP